MPLPVHVAAATLLSHQDLHVDVRSLRRRVVRPSTLLMLFHSIFALHIPPHPSRRRRQDQGT